MMPAERACAQHVAGAARVATHNDGLAEIDGGGLAEAIGHLTGQLHICDAAHAISSKQSGHEILLSSNSGGSPEVLHIVSLAQAAARFPSLPRTRPAAERYFPRRTNSSYKRTAPCGRSPSVMRLFNSAANSSSVMP